MKSWRDLDKTGKRPIPWWWIGMGVVGCGLIGLGFSPLPGMVKRGLVRMLEPRVVEISADEEDIRRQIESRLRSEMEQELQTELRRIQEEADRKIGKIEESYLMRPTRTSLQLGKVTDVRELRSGIPFISEVNVEQGGLASDERVDDDSYTVRYELKLDVPKAAQTIDELERQNAALGKMLPGLAGYLQGARVSDWYSLLYENKAERIRKQAHTLNELLTKHNFYDCETILEFEGRNGRKVLLMQAEMDVVSDGSDGDRLPKMPSEIVNSTHYQPFTSYGWPKRTKTPNPMVAGWEQRVGNARRELADPSTSASRKAWLKERIEYLKRGIDDMKARSFLIAEYDPFIVIPVNLLTSAHPYAPKVGDYAAVVYGGKIYPVIVGDGGPTFKVGEASLRMAKELNQRASPYSRPVSDLTVTYIVFPRSRPETKGPPDYAKWRTECARLLEDIGGLADGYALHEWKDLLAPKPAPVPPPAPTPPPAPASDASAPAAAPGSSATEAPGTPR